MGTRRTVFVWLTAGLAVALVATALRVTEQVMASMEDHGHDWWRVFVWQLAGWGFWTVAAPVLLRRGERLAEARPWWKALPAALAAGFVLVAVHLVFVAAVVRAVQHFQPVARYSFGEALSRQVERWQFVDLFAVAGLTGLGMILESYRRARELELNESRLEAELAHAELEALRLQLEPHFLFNTLNSIAALIHRDDRERALAMVVELGELLRETVGRSQRDSASLAEELAFVERYVALQRARFADRLEVVTSIADDCRALSVPTLSLQPLVENSIRHALGGSGDRLRVEVRAARVNGELEIVVSDDGRGLPAGFDVETDAGVGIGNLRSRLRRMYGERATFSIGPREGGGTVSRLSIPAVAMAVSEARLSSGAGSGEPAFGTAARRESR